MAEEEEKELEEEEGEQEEEKQGKAFPVKIVIMTIVFLFLFGGGFFIWRGGLLAKFLGDEETGMVDDTTTEEEGGGGIGPIFSLDTFIVNLVGRQGKSYLKVKLDLELENARVSETLNLRLPQFRDAVITLLSNKRFEDINTLEGKFQLRAEIISKLNQFLRAGKITNIYFTDFIIQ